MGCILQTFEFLRSFVATEPSAGGRQPEVWGLLRRRLTNNHRSLLTRLTMGIQSRNMTVQ